MRLWKMKQWKETAAESKWNAERIEVYRIPFFMQTQSVIYVIAIHFRKMVWKMHGISLEEEEVFEIHIHCFELERESKNSANCIWEKVSFNGASAAAVLYGIKLNYCRFTMANTWTKSHHAMFYRMWEIVICF